MKRLHSTGPLLRAPWIYLLAGVTASVTASAAVLLNESGVVIGIDGLQISGGGLNSVYDIRFAGGGLASALVDAPEQLLIYDNPAYGLVTAEAVALSISQVLNAGGHSLVSDGVSGLNVFVVPFESIPIDPEAPVQASLFYYAYDLNHPGTPNWSPVGVINMGNFEPKPIVLMQTSNPGGSVPEPETYAWISGVLLAGFAFWRHRRTS